MAEAESIKKHKGILIAVTAPRALRYERARERGRVGDDVSFEQFSAIEEKEASGKDPSAHNVDGVISMADYVIENTGTLLELHAKTDALMQKLGIQKQSNTRT